jgi:hypothetical protein
MKSHRLVDIELVRKFYTRVYWYEIHFYSATGLLCFYIQLVMSDERAVFIFSGSKVRC